MKKYIEHEGHFYLAVDDLVSFGGRCAACYNCALYKECPKDKRLAFCEEFQGNVHFIEVPRKNEHYDVNIDDISFTKTRVKYKGITVDKCTLKTLIHDTEFLLGNCIWPIYSDIYWFDTPYKDLMKKLFHNVQALWMLREQTQELSTT